MGYYDVIILGGAFSGASAAILLRREHPQLRVLIIEKATAFDEKVGEATTEMSAMFLTRRLAMWHHLEAEQLPKEGLRFWFSNEKVTGHANATEAGGYLRSAVPSFQLRRDALDEYLLATAVKEGAELLRPAKARDVQLGDFDSKLTVEVGNEAGDEVRELSCRWLLDATGRVTFLGRRLGIIERNDDHPTAAIWCRWRDVRNIDDLAARDGALGARNVSSRRLATNHYMGHGYWIWVIPLGNGETSVGVVFDKRIIDLHRSTNRGNDFIAFLKGIPALAELLDGASPRLDDLRFYGHLPYVTKQYMGKGWALLGDAAAFLDPYYSPGLDHAAFSVEATVALIGAEAKGEDVTSKIDEHNVTFVRSYHRFFNGVRELSPDVVLQPPLQGHRNGATQRRAGRSPQRRPADQGLLRSEPRAVPHGPSRPEAVVLRRDGCRAADAGEKAEGRRQKAEGRKRAASRASACRRLKEARA